MISPCVTGLSHCRYTTSLAAIYLFSTLVALAQLQRLSVETVSITLQLLSRCYANYIFIDT